MIKLIACGVVVSSFFTVGLLLSRGEKQAQHSLAAIIRLLEEMKSKITFYRLPLARIFEGFHDDVLERSGFTASLCSPLTDLPVSEKWHKAVTLLELEDNITAELIRFGEDLGVLDAQTQLKRIDAMIEKTVYSYKKQTAEYLSKGKVYKSVCTLAGLLIVILLY